METSNYVIGFSSFRLKNCQNINQKIETVFNDYSLDILNTLIVLDARTNMLAATSSSLRLIYACHMLNNVIQDAAKFTKMTFANLKSFKKIVISLLHM